VKVLTLDGVGLCSVAVSLWRLLPWPQFLGLQFLLESVLAISIPTAPFACGSFRFIWHCLFCLDSRPLDPLTTLSFSLFLLEGSIVLLHLLLALKHFYVIFPLNW